MIHYQCLECRSPLDFPNQEAGKQVNCPHCGTLFRVPQSLSPLLLGAAWISPVIPVIAVAPLMLGGSLIIGDFSFFLLMLGCPLGGIGAILGLIGAARKGWGFTAAVSVLGLVLNGLVVLFILLVILLASSLSGLPRC